VYACEVPPVARPWQRLTPLAIALVTFAVFAPTLGFGFVDFDDPRIIASNPHFRGLGWPQLRWMATATLMGHWMPVTWLTYGLDYTLWGMWPSGYHLGNVLLHSVDAGLLFVLSRRLLARALPGRAPVALTLGATFAALIFALHPMRAESVAWVTERRDVVSGFFFLLTILAYLRLIEASGESRRCWRLVALACFALALASKAIVMTLPAMLLVLDVFPLRRPLDRRLLLEKVPFFALSLVSAVITVLAVRAETEFSSIAALPPGPRLLIALHAFAFYASRLLVPFDLSPLHELPPVVALGEPRFLVSAGAVLAVTAAAGPARSPRGSRTSRCSCRSRACSSREGSSWPSDTATCRRWPSAFSPVAPWSEVSKARPERVGH
jgi:hypothetical protein